MPPKNPGLTDSLPVDEWQRRRRQQLYDAYHGLDDATSAEMGAQAPWDTPTPNVGDRARDARAGALTGLFSSTRLQQQPTSTDDIPRNPRTGLPLIPGLGVLAPQRYADAVRHHLDDAARPQIQFNYDSGPGNVVLPDELIGTINGINRDVQAATNGQSLTVTSGYRDANRQAAAMYANYGPGEPNYVNRKAAAQVRAEFDKGRNLGLSKDQAVANMAAVLQRQMDGGVYISKHMNNRALDIRKSTQAVRSALESHPAIEKLNDEGDHWHVQLK